MKRTAVPSSWWGQLASRAGVEPKKLAILVSVAGGAIVLLAGKMLLGGATKAAAKASEATAPTPAAAGAAPGTAAPGAAAGAPSSASTASASPAPASPGRGAGSSTGADDDSTIIEVHLDTQPRRDPFAPFIEKPKREALSAEQAPDDATLSAPDLAVFQLRATMDQEWVVVNDQTLRVGDIVGLAPDGTPIKLVEVGHRRAVVEWRGKKFELGFPR